MLKEQNRQSSPRTVLKQDSFKKFQIKVTVLSIMCNSIIFNSYFKVSHKIDKAKAAFFSTVAFPVK